MKAESKEKREEAETRNEGESSFHEHGDPGPGGCNLGEAVLAAIRLKPLPRYAVIQLMCEAGTGSLPALYALGLIANEEMPIEIPADLSTRLRDAMHTGDKYATYILATAGLKHFAISSNGDIMKKLCITLLHEASNAGVGEATRKLALLAAEAGKRDKALSLLKRAVKEGCGRAAETDAFWSAITALAPLAPDQSAPTETADQTGAEREAKIRSLARLVLTLTAEKEAATARAADAEAMVGAQQERVARDEEVQRYAKALRESNWLLLKATKQADDAIRSKQAADTEDRKLRLRIEVLEALVKSRGGRR